MMALSGERTSNPKSIASKVIHLWVIFAIFVCWHLVCCMLIRWHACLLAHTIMSPSFYIPRTSLVQFWNTTESSAHNNYDMTKRPTTPQMSSFNSEFSGAPYAKAWLVLATWRHMWENTRVPEQSGQDQHQHSEVQEYHLEFGQAWEEDISHFHLLWHPSSLPLVGHLYQGDQTGGTSGKLKNILSTSKKCKSKLCQSKISYPPMYHK